MLSLSNTWLALLFGVSVKSLLLALVAGAALVVLRVRNTNVRHRVWTGVLLGMIALPALTMVVPSLPLPASLSWAFALNEAETTAPSRTADLASPPSEIDEPTAVVVNATQASRPFVEEPASAEEGPNDAGLDPFALHAPTESPLTGDLRNDSGEAVLSPSRMIRSRPDSSLKLELWPIAVLAIYASGLAVFVCRFFIGILGARRLVGGAQPIPHDCLGISVSDSEMLARVTILENSLIRFPLTVRWLRPKILLPADWESWGKAKCRNVLAHELAHIERRDYLVTLLAECNRCLYWFHPLAWYLRSWLVRLAERACDDSVIASTGERSQYARHLLELASELAGRRDRLVQATAIPMARSANVEDRITAILDPKRPLARRIGRFGIAVLAAIAAPTILFAAALRPGSEQATDEPDTTETQQAPNESRAAGDTETAEDNGKDNSTEEKVDHPKVLEVYPPDGAADVKPDTEIRVRFDRTMDPLRVLVTWSYGSEGGFRPRGKFRYVERTHEFVLPVRLTPGCVHKLAVNEESHLSEGDYEGFCSVTQVAAETHSWSFTTAPWPEAPEQRRPKVVATDPPSDSEISLLNLIRVKFDRPMDPTWYGLADCYPKAHFSEKPELYHFVQYDPDGYEFTIPLHMPRNWNGEIELVHFRDHEGLEATPIRLKYRTLDDVVCPLVEQNAANAGKSTKTVALVEKIRSARAKLTSVSEKVLRALVGGSQPAWLERYDFSGSVFKMQGQRQFLAHIDHFIDSSFRMGSDGTTCWCRYKNEVTTCPFGDIAEKNLLFCDPFGAGGTEDAATIVREMKLDYLGDVLFDGRPCHKIRSWDVKLRAMTTWLTPVRDWYFDAQTLLPVCLETNGLPHTEYRYTRINQPIPDEEFQRETGSGIQIKDAEPLDEGYTSRFLNVIDGTNGRMSVRWGEKGPKGTRSGGLN